MERIIETLTSLNGWSTAFRLLLAVLFGGLIGLERGRHGRAAGLRTHILVCLGATTSSLVGLYAVKVLGISCDPLRVGAQVVSGIGFLGVGTIVVNKSNKVTGLTTAAGLWASACVGLAVGIGFYEAAVLSFLVILLTMALFIYLEKSVKTCVTFSHYMEFSNLSALNKMYTEALPYVKEAHIISAKSGLSGFVGLELTTDCAEKYQRVVDIASSIENVEISVPVLT